MGRLSTGGIRLLTPRSQTFGNVEVNTHAFRKDLDERVDHSPFDGREKEDRFNAKVNRFEATTDQLRSDFDREDSWWEVRNEVQKVVNDAKTVAQMIETASSAEHRESV